MGLFNEISFKCSLPAKGANRLLFQTKDLNPSILDLYEVRRDKTLWIQKYDTEDRSDPNAKGIGALVGLMTRVNKRWEPVDFTGKIRFYTDRDSNGRWIEFEAEFKSGKMIKVKEVKQ